MSFIGFLISVVALFFTLIALIPFLGWLNWFILPFAVLGLVLSAVGARGGLRWLGVLGIVLGVSAIILAGVRLIIGMGVF